MADENPSTEAQSPESAETKISATLAAFNQAISDDSSAPADDTSEETVEESGTETESEVESAESEAGGDGAEGANEDQQSDSPAPTIPAAHVRSLKAMQWTDEDIAAAEQANPAAFAATAARIHQTRTAEIKAWADLGRQRKAAEQGQGASQNRADQPPPALGQPIDAEALIEKYGSEDLIREIVEPLNRQLAAFQRMIPDVEAYHAVAVRARMDAAKQEVDSFFGDAELAAYRDQYGVSSDSLTPEQRDERIKVLDMADAIRNGAAAQGREMSIRDALAYAHEAVSGPAKAAAVRQQVRAQVEKRSSSRSVRPTATNRAGEARPSNSAELEKVTAQRLAALG